MTNRFFLVFVAFLLLLSTCTAGLGAGIVLTSRLPWLATLAGDASREPAVTPAIIATVTPALTAILPATQTPAPAPPNSEQGDVDLSAIDPELRLIRIYRAASPAVVNITTQVMRPDFFFGSVPESGSGSGFVWDDQGHILTNYHVIEGAQSIVVAFADDLAMEAEVVGVDPANDLAVLKVTALPNGVTSLPLGDSATLEVGQVAVAIGNPFGQFKRTLTSGIISALDRTIEFDDGKVLRGVIQTDAAINRGNSGGPLLDSDGRVIGIASAIYSPSGVSAGVGLAIPINKAKRVVPVLIQTGRYRHPWLGIEQLGYVLTPALAQALDLPVREGILIAQLYRDSPAQQAGVRGAEREVIIGNRRWLVGGDILTAIDGVPVGSWEDLNAYLQERSEVGHTVTLELLRNGETLELPVVVGEEPS